MSVRNAELPDTDLSFPVPAKCQQPFRGSQYPQQETESEQNWLPATEKLLCLFQATSYSSLGAKRGTRGSSYRQKCVITISCYEKPPMQQILVVSFVYIEMNQET